MIRYHTHRELDFDKWDTCIAQAEHSLIYGFSWYLDAVCDDWDGLVMNDYEAVFPLPKRKKGGVPYVYQPFFCQKLGLFAANKNIKIDDFINAIPSHFQYVEMNICHNDSTYIHRKNINYELVISQDSSSFFSKNTKRNLKKADDAGLRLVTKVSFDEHLIMFKNDLKKMGLKKKDLQYYKSLCTSLLQINKGSIYGVCEQNNTLLATALFANDDTRMYYLHSASTSKGKKTGASHFLVNELMKLHIGKIVDFEGSNIEGVARFYKGFGAHHTFYSTVKINRLPFYLRWLKS